MSVLDTIQETVNAFSVKDGQVAVNLSDAQADWVTENLVTFLQNSDPNSKLRTNFLKKVIIPASYKVYLPYVLLLVGSSVGAGYFITKAMK
jgi:hypothetical protein